MDNTTLETIYESLLQSSNKPASDIISVRLTLIQGKIASARADFEILRHQFQEQFPDQSDILIPATDKCIADLQEVTDTVDQHFVRYFAKK